MITPAPNGIPVFNDPKFHTLVPTSYNGQPGWFNVPGGFYSRINPDTGATEASPEPDFSWPVYQTHVNYDGNLVCQDLLIARYLGTA